MFVCSLSGEIAKEPVLSPTSGKIFEKKLIINYLSTNNKDPINDEPLTIEELISINTDNDIIPPKQPNVQSIPSLLGEFQNQFDSMALENFTLRKQLNKAREELSSALYHYDAAVQVAANAIKERDDAQKNLQELAASIGNGVMEDEEQEEDEEGDIEEFKQTIKTCNGQLFQLHKSQKFTLPIVQDINIDIEDLDTIKDPKIVYYDEIVRKLLTNSGKQLNIKDLVTKNDYTVNHKGALTSLNLVQYNDSLVPVYSNKNSIKLEDKTIKFGQNVVDIKSHPKDKSIYVVLCNKSFTLLQGEERMITVDLESKPTTCEFHVDGALLLIGVQGQILIYDILEGDFKGTVSTKYSKIERIISGLNGYWVLVSSSDKPGSSIDIIDLRKLSITHSIEVESLIDFVIDKSCSLILSSTKTEINIHKYIKKGKVFQDFADKIDIPNVQHLYITENGDNQVKVLGLTSSQIKSFDLKFLNV